MTDAGFAIVGGKAGGKTTEQCVDGVIASTGCTVGNRNLLLIHRSKTSPLWFAFYNNATGESLYFVVNESVFGMSIEEFEALPDEEVFTTISNYSPGRIAPVWAKGAPYEFLKAVEFHNHVCPGLTSGYYLIKYLDENLPLQSSRDKYEIIGCPPWCKDDALQVIFDKTVGKRFVAMHLTSEDRAKLPSGTAGIYIRWNGTTNTGHGLVLAFNWSKVTELCGKVSKTEKAVCMMDYLDQPEMFVSTVHEFDLSNSAELSALKYAGKNAYVELGLLPDPALANLVGPDNIVVDNLLGWRAAEIAKQELGFKKYDPDVLAMTDASFAIVGGEAGGKTT
jgi:formylmethanofuran dehydrogenase subunit E-like metal-binding protein